MVRYYIVNLEKFIKHFRSKSTHLPAVLSKNVVEIDTPRQRAALIEAIKKTDWTEDAKFQEYVKDKFPTFLKYVEKVPIELTQFKKGARIVFQELPEDCFQEKSTITSLKRMINFIITKHELFFVITNILNGKLRYDHRFRHKEQYQFYFRMMKLNYDLPEYYAYILNTQRLMEKIFLKYLIFSDGKRFGKKELAFFRETHNFIGNNLVDFRDFLKNLQQKILRERRLIDSTKIPLPQQYEQEEKQLLQLTKDLIKALEEEIINTAHRKDQIEQFIEKQKGLITKEKIRMLLDLLGVAEWFF